MFVQVSMVTFYNISDWEEKEYFNTGGTRNKVVVENTKDEKSYFFKTSLNKKEKNYTYEFWSEVIASEVGQLLGFNVLQYDVAVNKQTLGCLSKSIFELLRKIAQTGYKSFIAEEINRIRKLYDKEKLKTIIHHIDDCLPKSFEAEKIPENRKNLLTKLLTLRIERLLSETLRIKVSHIFILLGAKVQVFKGLSSE